MRTGGRRGAEAESNAVVTDHGPITPRLQESGFVLGHGASWLDLVGTVIGWHYDEPIELLESPARLRSWLELQELDIGREPTWDELEQAHWIRAGLRELASAVVYSHPPRRSALRAVNGLLADQPAGPRLAYDAPSARLVQRRPRSVAMALVTLSRTAVTQLTGADAERLRDCAAEDCTRIFLPPNDRRQWCPGGRCGNRTRVRAHRARGGTGS